MFFSPIREKSRPHFINEKIITEHKRKIHQDIKKFQSFDPFPLKTCSSSNSEESNTKSPLVKLFQLVQSPVYQGKNLLKTNRELEKSIMQLEHKLFLNSSAETDFQRMVAEEKQKNRQLDKEVKRLQMVVHSRDDTIMDKDKKIERLQHFAVQNKRLDEKMKDYQAKIKEIQLLTTQLEEKFEENRLLKIENRELNHFKALAIDRRMKIEYLTSEINNHKNCVDELSVTRLRLSETESQLIELQNHMHSLQRNTNNDSLSEISVNSSFLNPECMSDVFELDRDELRNELSILRTKTVPKLDYDFVKRQIDDLTQFLFEMKITLMPNNSMDRALDSEIVDDFKQMFKIMSGNMEKLSATKDELTEQLNIKIEAEKRDKEHIESLEMSIGLKDKGLSEIGNILFQGRSYNINSPEFIEEAKLILHGPDESRKQFELMINELKSQLGSLKTILENDIQQLKECVGNTRQLTAMFSQSFMNDFELFKQCLSDSSLGVTLSDPFLISLYDFHQLCKHSAQEIASLRDKIEDGNNQNIALEHNLQNIITEYQDKIVKMEKDWSNEREEQNKIITKLTNDYNVVKNEKIKMNENLNKMEKEHQNILVEMEKMSSTFESDIKLKDDKLNLVQTDVNQLEDQIKIMKEKYNVLCKTIKDKDMEMCLLQQQHDNEVLCCNERLETLTEAFANERSNLEAAREQYETMKAAFDHRYQQDMEKSQNEVAKLMDDIFDLKLCSSSKDAEMESLKNYHDAEMQKLLNDVMAKNSDISNQLQQIDHINKIVSSKDIEILDWKNKLSSIEESNRSMQLELDQLRTIKSQHEDLTAKYDNFRKSLSDSISEKDKQLVITNRELSQSKDEIVQLKSDLDGLNKELNANKREHSEIINKMQCHFDDQRTIMNDKMVIQLKEIDQMKLLLQEHENTLGNYKDQVARLEMLLEESKINCSTIRAEREYLSAIDVKHVELTKVHQELERRFEKYQKESEAATQSKSIEITSMKYQIDHLQERLNHADADKTEHLSTISHLTDELCSCQTSMKTLKAQQAADRNEYDTNLDRLRQQMDDLSKEKTLTTTELSVANESLNEFAAKIQNLETIIEGEMSNYEKISEEYKHVEQESNQYREKYVKLIKKHQEEVTQLETTVSELNQQINRIEEERDDQIHEMEKSFNGKIFDLQQSFDDKSAELDSVKKEIMESRKISKSLRVALELENERLQKVLTTRQTQFTEEKTNLTSSLEKEREEKLKQKEFYDETVARMNIERRISDDKLNGDLNTLRMELDKVQDCLKTTQIDKTRTEEMFKKCESEYKNQIEILERRIQELEPLEKQIEHFESKTHLLMTKLGELESSENVRDLKHLRLELVRAMNAIKLLEKDKCNINGKHSSLEIKLKSVMKQNNEFTKEINRLNEKNDYLKDQIHNLESLDKAKQDKIERFETEIESMNLENESLKSRYLKLREISDNHVEKVLRTHEQTVSNYIERIGSLTKNVENFQEQIQILTVKKNMLKDDNCALKRSVGELTSKLSSLKQVLREHTENEMQQLGGKYSENTRYARMSSWGMRPVLTRQLPPVDRIDKDSAYALGLDPKTKMKFESFVFSPYSCEDEPSVSLQKHLPADYSSIHTDTESNDNLSGQLATPLKKKKDGIRHQLTSKIRRSLHLDTNDESKSTASKRLLGADTPSTSSLVSNAVTGSKPPVAPRKNIVSKLRSSQVSVIDLDQYRQRKEQKQKLVLSHSKKNKDDNSENLYSVASTTAANISSAKSICSLFENNEEDVTNNTPEESETRAFESPYTQRPKTPKPNSIIKRLIRKSKARTPKMKFSTIDKLIQ